MASKRKEALKLLVTLEVGEDGYIIAECPAIPGCVSQGRTREEALENIKDAILACLEVRKRRGMPLTVETHEIEVAV
jgi:predicted RNase H-like HicB family nuclease